MREAERSHGKAQMLLLGAAAAVAVGAILLGPASALADLPDTPALCQGTCSAPGSCSADSDCPPGATCVDGTCSAPDVCQNEADCPRNATCDVPDDCCASFQAQCVALGAPLAPEEPNILLVISDDQAYCSYPFMREGLPDETKVRIDDLSCRYRAPQGDRPKKAFVFNRGSFDELFPESHLETPTLDSLADQGAVFPMAHLVANVCQPSITGLLTGKYLKDLRGYAADGSRYRTCECRLTNVACGASGSTSECGEDTSSCTADLGPCQADGTCSGNPLIACTTDPDCQDSCGRIRTMQNILHYADVVDLAQYTGPFLYPGYATSTGPKVWHTKANVAGDGDSTGYRVFGRRGVGRFKCKSDCDTELRAGFVPRAAKVGRSSVERLTTVLGDIDTPHPFFMWYAPKLPHHGFNSILYFREKFCEQGSTVRETRSCKDPKGGRSKLVAKYLANVEYFDVGLAAVVDKLKRTCICDGTQAKSLYDRTIVFFLSDNGWMLPKGKNYRGPDLAGANGYRTVLVVSHYRHRGQHLRPGEQQIGAGQFPGQLADAVDVVRTILEYAAAGGNVKVPWDLKGKDLRPWIEDPANAAQIRPVVIGQWGGTRFQTREERHLVTAPGVVGICNGTCSSDADCGTGRTCVAGRCSPLSFCLGTLDCGSAETCDLGARLCMNSPETPCNSDDDCDEGLCYGGGPAPACLGPNTFPPAAHGFKDFEGIDCRDFGDSACRPSGVCQEPILRFARSGAFGAQSFTERVYNLSSDPDENAPLDTAKVSDRMRCMFRKCLELWDAWSVNNGTTPDEPDWMGECLTSTPPGC